MTARLSRISVSSFRRNRVSFSSQPDRRGTLRDLYTSGLVSIFRRDSVLRVWEPLRQTPRITAD